MTYSDDGDGSVYVEEIKQINHYYPYGANMEGNWNGSFPDVKNKYQYNEKELNTDFGLDWTDYGARFYDPTVSRWLGVDPLSEKYLSWSPYVYVKNNPVKFIDPNGKDIILVISIASYGENKNSNNISYRYANDGKLYDVRTGNEYKGNDKFLRQTQNALNQLKNTGDVVSTVIDDLMDSKLKHKIVKPTSAMPSGSNNKRDKDGTRTIFTPEFDRATQKTNFSDAEILGHELKHGYNKVHGIDNANMDVNTGQKTHTGTDVGAPGEEVDAVNFQNVVRQRESPWLLPRTTYGVDISSKLSTPTLVVPYKSVIGY